MKFHHKKSDGRAGQFDGYPIWRKEERAERLKQCFAMLPITTLVAICGRNAVVKVAAAFHCQATMQGRKTKIVPYAGWRQALGISKRTYFRAIATLAGKHFLRRHHKGPGRKVVIELLGPLAQFQKTSNQRQSMTRRSPSSTKKQSKRGDVWSYIADPSGTQPA